MRLEEPTSTARGATALTVETEPKKRKHMDDDVTLERKVRLEDGTVELLRLQPCRCKVDFRPKGGICGKCGGAVPMPREFGSQRYLYLLKSIKAATPERCLIWPYSKSRDGYGIIWLNGKNRTVHRVSFAVFNDRIDPTLDVCHSCDVKPCFNPFHLWEGTTSDNVRDSWEKGRRSLAGERHPLHKLTADQVRIIRQTYVPRKNSAQLAERFGVSQGSICKVVTRETWSEAGDE